jgi:hypothetical protein
MITAGRQQTAQSGGQRRLSARAVGDWMIGAGGKRPLLALQTVRAALAESSRYLIRKDKAIRKKYELIRARAGGKRTIVAVYQNYYYV